MYKKEILSGFVNNHLLLNIIYEELGYRQSSMGQSFRRSLATGKKSGHSHDDNVKEIVEKFLKISKSEIYES